MTLAIPMPKFEAMVDNIDESFLRLGDWEKVKTRITRCRTDASD
jgi:hypothetical protein